MTELLSYMVVMYQFAGRAIKYDYKLQGFQNKQGQKERKYLSCFSSKNPEDPKIKIQSKNQLETRDSETVRTNKSA